MYTDKLDDILNKDNNIYHSTIIFTKGSTPNWSEEVKDTVQWTYVMEDLNGERIVGTFYKKNCKRQIYQMLELKK